MTSPDPLLTVRAALVLLGGLVIALTAGLVAYFAYESVATAALVAASRTIFAGP